MPVAQSLESIPDIILILGTDAAGKDHTAGVIEKMLLEAGFSVEKRKRYLCGKVTRGQASTDKGRIELTLERCFIALLPFFGFLLPGVLNRLLVYDLARYRKTEKKIIVIGHNCLRGLALYWGKNETGSGGPNVPAYLEKTLDRMRNIEGLHSIVLDVDNGIRQKRIRQREQEKEADNFDRYMAENGAKAERIEEMLINLSQNYLEACLITNNDLSEMELRRQIVDGFRS